MSSARLARLDGVIEAAISDGEAPGAVVLVARRGRIAYRKAFGHRSLVSEERPMKTDTVFDMASLTKVIATATSVMILVEEGKVSLEDAVSRYVPEFERHGKESITVLELLTHYSGLRPDIDLDEPWKGYDTAIERGNREKLVAVPSERFIYSDINYFLLGELVHRVSGMSLAEFASQRIFRPLRMNSTTFNPPDEWRDRIAPTEPRGGKMLWGRVHDPTSNRMGGVSGHAGLFSTVDDISIFAQTILDGGVYRKTRILSPLGVRRMIQNQSPAGKEQWRGVGFDIRTRFSSTRGDLFPVGSFGHTGFTGTSLWIDPFSKTFVILLTSRLHPDGSGNVVSMRRKVASVVAASILDSSLTTTGGKGSR